MQSNYSRYKAEVSEEIETLIADMGCQPVLFIGAGLSKRLFGAPNWEELLAYLAGECPKCDREYAYYKQKCGTTLGTGTALAGVYHEWAWSTGKNKFPSSVYGNDAKKEYSIKYKIAEHLLNLRPNSLEDIADSELATEIKALQSIRPHAIITTNYDTMLELIFPDYAPIVGQSILHSHALAVGEIFKIHGCVTDPPSLVFTEEDYAKFIKKKKYLSAKLLTYFTEHPILLIGYSAEDANIRAILSDVDEALPISGDTIKNIYFLEWKNNTSETDFPAKDKLLAIEDAKSVRVRCIVANRFDWVYEAFKSPETVSKISPKILRALLARSYELVRSDIPRKTVEADFQMLESAVHNSSEMAKLLGLTTISDPCFHSARYPYTATELARQLGFERWHPVDKLIKRVLLEKGVDLKASDNSFHHTVKLGKSKFHKYSDEALILFKKMQRREEYEVQTFAPSTVRCEEAKAPVKRD